MRRGVALEVEEEEVVVVVEVGLVDLAAAFVDLVVMGAILGTLIRRRSWC